MNPVVGRTRINPPAVVAAIRLTLVLTILLAEQAETPFGLRQETFTLLLVATIIWAVLLALVSLVRPRERITPTEAVVDLALLGGLTYATGGPFSEVRQAFFVIPVVAAATQSPRATATWGLLGGAAFTLAALSLDVEGLPGAASTTLASDLYLAAIAAVTVLLAVLIEDQRREAQVEADRSSALARQLLDVVDAERRRLARALHDHPVQLLGAAAMEIGEVRKGDPQALDRLRKRIELANDALRKIAIGLNPYALEKLGLAKAVRRVATEASERAGIALHFDCDPVSRSEHDPQIFAIIRELIANAAQHSKGSEFVVRIEDAGDAIVVEVRDDGVGIDPERQRTALAEGHLGLISVHERAEMIGAELDFPPVEIGTLAILRARCPR